MFKISLDGKHYYDLANDNDSQIFSTKLKQKVWDNVVDHLKEESLTKTLDTCIANGINYNLKEKSDQINFLKVYLTVTDQDLNVSKNK